MALRLFRTVVALLLAILCRGQPFAVKYGGFVRDGKLFYTGKKVESQQALWAGEYVVADYFDAPEVLRHLYGDQFDPQDKSGKGGVFVFGNHNTGTSMLTRLVMLFGAFQGNLEGLSTSPTNRLKYWEKLAVSHFHDMLLAKYSDPRFKPYHAQGLDLSTMHDEDRRRLRAFASRVLRDQDRRPPWVLKDPRMLFFAQTWVSAAAHPVCVITYKEPIGNAISLTGNRKKSAKGAKGEMTVERWLDVWEKGMLNVLFACSGYPSVLVEAERLKGNISDIAASLLWRLQRAGVVGLRMPSAQQLQAEFGAFLKPSRSHDADLAAYNLTATQEALDFALRKAMALTQDEDSVNPAQTVNTILDIWKSHAQLHDGMEGP